MENDTTIAIELESTLLIQVEAICESLDITVENLVQQFLKKVCEEKILLQIVADALKEERMSREVSLNLLKAGINEKY